MRVLLCWILAAAILVDVAFAQQSYPGDNEGYTCSNYTETCQTYILYKAQQGDTVQSVATLFQVSKQQIYDSSTLSSSVTNLEAGRAVIIPATCACNTGRYQYNVTYVIQKGDTFYLVSNNTFEGLTHYLAVERANPQAVPTNLQPGDKIIFPIRCACPTSNQTKNGTKYLMTDSIFPNETVASIAKDWNISERSIRSANVPTSGNSLVLTAFTTILLPLTSVPTVINATTPPSSLTPAPSSQPPPPPPPSSTGGGSSSHVGTYVGIGVGVAVLVLVLGLALCFFYTRKKRKAQKDVSYKTDANKGFDSIGTQPILDLEQSEKADHKQFLAGMVDLVDSDKAIIFSYEELKAATQNFSPSHLIQGSVYRGFLGGTWVAIKEMRGTMNQELKILCKVHHSNLVKLVGICDSPQHLYLVYEYAENGSLYDCLHGVSTEFSSQQGSSSAVSLNWVARMQIALDVATGLEYIHDYTNPSFVHKDIKSSNILLDGSFHAKIANFGMAKFADSSQSHAASPMLTSHVVGTQGYMPPEYVEHGIVSPKLDVYALGVIFLELLSGLEAILRDEHSAKYLAGEIGSILSSANAKEKLQKWIDSRLENAFPLDCAYEFAVLAKSCVEDDPSVRPSMKEITYRLSKLLEASIEWQKTAVANRSYAKPHLEGR